jgi:hypothetical protein
LSPATDTGLDKVAPDGVSTKIVRAAVARIVVQQPGQEMVGFGFGVISVRPLVGELLLNCIDNCLISGDNDGCYLPMLSNDDI